MYIYYRHHFDAAHRLKDYQGPCSNVHGHRYVVEFKFVGEDFDRLGMLVDFSELKRAIGDWINEKWDHAFLINSQDIGVLVSQDFCNSNRVYFFNGNPTAEKMVSELWVVTANLIAGFPVRMCSIRLWETPDFSVEISV